MDSETLKYIVALSVMAEENIELKNEVIKKQDSIETLLAYTQRLKTIIHAKYSNPALHAILEMDIE